MKTFNLNFKNSIIALSMTLLPVATLFTSCGNGGGNDNNPTPNTGDISAAVGTFKGNLTIDPVDGMSEDYFDAIVNVTKAGDDKLKVSVKSGEPYSSATPKTFIVESASSMGQAVMAVVGSIEGSFIYKVDLQTLLVGTEQQSASEVTFFFEGKKQ